MAEPMTDDRLNQIEALSGIGGTGWGKELIAEVRRLREAESEGEYIPGTAFEVDPATGKETKITDEEYHRLRRLRAKDAVLNEDEWITEKALKEAGCDCSAGSRSCLSDTIHPISDVTRRLANAFRDGKSTAIRMKSPHPQDAAFEAQAKAVIEMITGEKDAVIVYDDGCPCKHTTPCSDSCTCADGMRSGGCRRCASYGSDEQRKQNAEHLARILDEHADAVLVPRETLERWATVSELVMGDYRSAVTDEIRKLLEGGEA